MTSPRLLVLVGSGETAPQMQRGYRMLVERMVGPAGKPSSLRAAIVDTPYRFQENAAALSQELLDFFGRRVGLAAQLAAFGRADEDPVTREAAYEVVRAADFVFSGPGSPSYAVRHWRSSPLPEIFTAKVTNGGTQVFASAAALTMGRLTMPVYELYKGGADPYWLTGLDVLGAIGINAAVLPHYDNAEGSGHDTRFCFLGERRLRTLEEQMPSDTYVLGIDEHTALMLDLDEGSATILGRGCVTVREQGASVIYETGAVVPVSEFQRSPMRSRPIAGTPPGEAGEEDSLARRVLEVERVAAQATIRSAMVEPMLQALLELRATARSGGDYAAADSIRDRLTALGVELTDEADGTTSYRLPD